MLVALLALAAHAHAPDPPPLEAVVLVMQGPGVCAGAFVDDAGTVATAYHCVAPGGRPMVTTHDGRSAAGRVHRVDVSMDLALVTVPELASGIYLPLATEPPPVGARVRAMGHPYGLKEPAGFMQGTLRWALSEGVVSAVGDKSLQFSAPVNPGNSGGPVVDDSGTLVGVVSRRLGGDGIAFAARSDGVAELLAAEGRKVGAIGGTLGLAAFIGVLEPPGSGQVTVGARLSASLRDRVVVSGAYSLPLSARWNAVRFGEAVYNSWEVRGALRQRILRGQWTSYLEVFGGVHGLTTLTEDDSSLFRRSDQILPLVGVALSVGGTTLDLGVSPTDDGWIARYQAVLRWPGTFWMF